MPAQVLLLFHHNGSGDPCISWQRSLQLRDPSPDGSEMELDWFSMLLLFFLGSTGKKICPVATLLRTPLLPVERLRSHMIPLKHLPACDTQHLCVVSKDESFHFEKSRNCSEYVLLSQNRACCRRTEIAPAVNKSLGFTDWTERQRSGKQIRYQGLNG